MATPNHRDSNPAKHFEIDTDTTIMGEIVGGFTVVAGREDGADAKGSYQELLPDAVIMNIQMPHMNGFEAVSTNFRR